MAKEIKYKPVVYVSVEPNPKSEDIPIINALKQALFDLAMFDTKMELVKKQAFKYEFKARYTRDRKLRRKYYAISKWYWKKYYKMMDERDKYVEKVVKLENELSKRGYKYIETFYMCFAI